MKKILFASTALVLTAGYAAAEVTTSGDGRMGIVYGESADDNANEFSFNSRIRIKFTATGETDTGLAFGGSIRADNAGTTDVSIETDNEEDDFIATTEGGGVNGLAGSVFISGAFGKLTMGDTDSAGQAAVGQVSGVGYTGIGDLNEIAYIANGDEEMALYEGAFGGFTVYASVGQIGDDVDTGRDLDSDGLPIDGTGDEEHYSIGAGYDFNGIGLAIGYEKAEGVGDHIILGASGDFAGATVKAVYGIFDGDGDDNDDFDQFAVSADYTFGATTVTGFVKGDDVDDENDDLNYGIGAAYDLGGGASLKGGIAHDGDSDGDSDIVADFGITMTF